MDNAANILKYAMDMEKRAQEFYTFYQHQVKSPAVKELFTELATMEADHYNLLKDQLDSLEKTQSFRPFELSTKEGAAIIDSQKKAVDKLAATMDQFDLSDLPILRMAYSMESDFATFYENAAQKATGETEKKLLCILADWEREHRDSFAAQVELVQQKSWFAQGFAPF